MNSTKHNLRKRISIQEGWISIVVNVLLFILKFWAGIVSGSLALIADAWHTLSDSISSILVLISAGFSHKKPDKEHPFGHGRFELVATIFIGVLLILIGGNFIKEGAERFIHKESANYGTVAIIVTIISIVLKEGLSQFAFWGYRKTKAGTLKADGWHHRSDAISSGVILLGIFIGRDLWWIDAFLSIVVAVFLIYTAINIIKNSISVIMGERADDVLVQNISKMANTLAGRNVMVHHVHLHNYIVHSEMTLHVKLPSDYTIHEAHEIVNSIEKSIKDQYDISATIHVDPL